MLVEALDWLGGQMMLQNSRTGEGFYTSRWQHLPNVKWCHEGGYMVKNDWGSDRWKVHESGGRIYGFTFISLFSIALAGSWHGEWSPPSLGGWKNWAQDPTTTPQNQSKSLIGGSCLADYSTSGGRVNLFTVQVSPPKVSPGTIWAEMDNDISSNLLKFYLKHHSYANLSPYPIALAWWSIP